MSTTSRSIQIGIALAIAANALADETTKAAAYDNLKAPANLAFAGTVGASDETNPTSVQFLVEAKRDQKTGTASVERKSGQANFRLSFTGPIDKDADEAVPLTLDGLTTGSKGELAASFLNWRGPNRHEREDWGDLCLRKLSIDVKKQQCKAKDFLDEDDRRYARELLHTDDQLWYLGASVSVGRGSFKYIDPSSLAAGSAIHNEWSAASRVGRYFTMMGFVVASYSYAKSFSPGKSTQLCRPFGSDGSLRCDAVTLGPPSEGTSSVLTLELRRIYANGVGINPTIQRDLRKKVTAVVLPVYFLRGEKGVIGGLRGGWRSDTSAATVSLFIGAAFTMLPQ